MMVNRVELIGYYGISLQQLQDLANKFLATLPEESYQDMKWVYNPPSYFLAIIYKENDKKSKERSKQENNKELEEKEQEEKNKIYESDELQKQKLEALKNKVLRKPGRPPKYTRPISKNEDDNDELNYNEEDELTVTGDSVNNKIASMGE